MTADEAREILRDVRGGCAWINWDNDKNEPAWVDGEITLDGTFTGLELFAILLFMPKEQP